MGARGNRFALNQRPRRDKDGHSLPSDKFMWYVELKLVCKRHVEGERSILGAWFIESKFEQFDPCRVNERRPNSAIVERQDFPDGRGGIRLRYKMRCPKCGQQPVLRQETVDKLLSAIYEQGAHPKEVQFPI